MAQDFDFPAFKKKGRKGCNVVGSRPVWAKLPTLGLGKKMGKMGLVTRWLKTNFGKISKLVR